MGLSPEAIAELRKKITALGASGNCDTATIIQAQRIAEPAHQGSALNVYLALPKLAEEARKGKDARINCNGNDTVDVFELTAAMIAAAQVASKNNINIEDVSIEEITRLVPNIADKLLHTENAQCGKPEPAKGK